MTDWLSRLQEVFGARTKGPWERYENEPQYLIRETNHPNSDVLAGHIIAECSPKVHWSYGMTSCCKNAAFIALCGTIGDEMLAVVREVAEVEHWPGNPKTDKIKAAVAALKAKVEVMR